jgi:hypothetical protein
MYDKDFFNRDLSGSRWFWEGVAHLGLVLLVLLVTYLNRGWPPLVSHAPFLAVAVVFLAFGWWASIQEFCRIQALNLDWGKIEPGTPLHTMLCLAVARIKRASYMYAWMAIATIFATQ